MAEDATKKWWWLDALIADASWSADERNANATIWGLTALCFFALFHPFDTDSPRFWGR